MFFVSFQSTCNSCVSLPNHIKKRQQLQTKKQSSPVISSAAKTAMPRCTPLATKYAKSLENIEIQFIYTACIVPAWFCTRQYLLHWCRAGSQQHYQNYSCAQDSLDSFLLLRGFPSMATLPRLITCKPRFLAIRANLYSPPNVWLT